MKCAAESRDRLSRRAIFWNVLCRFSVTIANERGVTGTAPSRSEINENMRSEHHKMNPSSNPMSLRAINALNARFWAKQTRLTERRIADPMSYDAAKRDIDSEAIRVTIRERKSLDQALADAEETVKAVRKIIVAAERERRKSICRSGGLARKTDALQILIQQLVRETPGMGRRDLWYQLKREQGRDIITAIDEKEIKFLTSNGKSKSAPVSGLKDRLHSAKRK
jgi:hypothetical protein